MQNQAHSPCALAVLPMRRRPRVARRIALLHGVSVAALLAAGPVRAAGGSSRSLNQAVALQSNTAVASAAAGGGVTAAAAAGLGAQNLATAAARFRSLSQALQNQGGVNLPAVPNGTASGGLVQAPGVAGSNGGSLWIGANTNLGVQTVGGVTDVTVTQTQSVADLTWKSFNIGAKTKLIFNQSAGGSLASSWVVINQIQDPSALPSTILGEISAPGKVYVINQNGIAFGAGSQVNVGALIAATANIAQTQFGTSATGALTFNLYGAASGNTYLPTFTAGLATADVTVAAGADIETPAPSGANGGGYVMLLGGSVSNAGVIGTPQGQTILAAGTDFTLRPGYSPNGNAVSTTLGSEIAASNGTGFSSGTAMNSGVIVADQGDITIVGHVVAQDGVVLSTTTVNQRGSVHLLTDISDESARIILAPDSVTEVLPEDNGATALDAQRAANIATSLAENAARPNQTGSKLNDTNILPDQAGESRIEISTGGTVNFQSGALAIAQGGQVAVGAGQQIVLQSGSTIDVSGTSDAVLPAAMNSLLINVQPYQLRDSAGNRNGALKSDNVYVDARQLVEVASGAYAGNVYTPGGLLEVGGYLGLIPHGINEWTATGGQVVLQSATSISGSLVLGQVITQPGSVINLTGGLVRYQGGALPQSYVQAADGQIYNVNVAPGDLVYTGIYVGETVAHPRWHIADTYVSPLTTPATAYGSGYVVGRDAGSLSIDTPTAVLEGIVDAGVTLGPYQTGVRPASVTDPYLLAQSVVPLAGSLSIGQFTGGLLSGAYDSTVTFQAGQAGPVQIINGQLVPLPLLNTVLIDAGQITQDGFANVTIATTGDIGVVAPLSVADGGTITLAGAKIDASATVTARGGKITLTNLLPSAQPAALGSGPGSITLAGGATLDARGVWTNAVIDPVHVAGEGFANGGSVVIDSTGGVTLAAGTTIDVSSGGAFLAGGKLLSSAGGNVSITADTAPGSQGPITSTLPIHVASRIIGYGVSGGGTLTLDVPSLVIGNGLDMPVTDVVVLDPTFFQNGFASYVLNGFYGASLAADTQVQVAMPVFVEGNAPIVPTGGDPASAYDVLLPALYVQTRGSDSYTQRAGSSLTLTANINPTLFNGGGGPLTIFQGASITVDPKQSITLSSYGQASVLGTLTAHSGTISVLNTRSETLSPDPGTVPNYQPGLSVWIGAEAVLDASGTAVRFTDGHGTTFGGAGNGGTIDLGVASSQTTEGVSTYAEIVVRPGAMLNVSGAATTVDVVPGVTTDSFVTMPAPVTLAGNGGTIVARSYSGLALDGTLDGAAGAPDASGGALVMRLDDLNDFSTPLAGLPVGFYQADEILVSQIAVPVIDDPSLQPSAPLPASAIGIGRISEVQLAEGGFGQLTLQGSKIIAFDGSVDLHLSRSVTLLSPVIGETQAQAQVTVTAPYLAILGDKSSGNAASHLSSLTSDSTLTIDAGLIDVQNATNLGGVQNTFIPVISNGVTTTVPYVASAFGFAEADFDSSGDIRLGIAGTLANRLDSSGNLVFEAAQLYPTTGANMLVLAGDNQNAAQGAAEFLGSISVERLGGAAPQAPFSVGGTLQLFAGEILQDGIIRAPEGEIVLGDGDELFAPVTGQHPAITGSVTLGAGSVTSVSLNGLTIPYGGTLDGVNYNYAGSPVGTFNPVILLQGQKVTVAAGATVDISGGGTLAGAGFIPGRGGSIDVNAASLISSVTGTVAATAADSVYAILPGYAAQYAPIAPGNSGYATPAVGAQITVAAGEVPGLAAGTYTLLPAYYDLLPGGFRVELSNTQLVSNFADSVGNFTTVAAVTLRTANTAIAAPVQTAALFTSGAGVRQLSQYDEESYNSFETNSAATFDSPRPLLPQDAKTLAINIDQVAVAGQAALSIAPSSILQTPDTGGFGATVDVASIAPIEILGAGGALVQVPGGLPPVGVSAAALNALAAPRLVIGGTLSAPLDGVVTLTAEAPTIEILPGATLTAGDVMLSVAPSGTINVTNGATISTIGRSATAYGLANGYSFTVDNGTFGSDATLDVSNTQNVFVPAVAGAGAALINVASGATVLAGGSLNFVAPSGAAVEIGQAHLGGKYVDIEVASINIGTPATLANDAAILPPGFALDTASLATLLNGDAAAGVPAATQLILTASESVNILGSVALNTGSTDLVLNTPAIYGFGGAADAVSITAKAFTWSGVSTVETLQTGSLTTASALAGGQIAGSDSNITGSLLIAASAITLGYGTLSQPNDQVTLDRTIAGFSNVTLDGTSEITANDKSALSVYASIPNFGQAGIGGNLTFDTPLLTTQSGAQLHVQAGGAFSLANSGGTVATTGSVSTLGGEIDITARQIAIASAVALPSGSLNLVADGAQTNVTTSTSSTVSNTGSSTVTVDTVVSTGTVANASISLLAGTNIDLAARATKLFDQTAESHGGTLTLESASGVVTTTNVTTTVVGLGPIIPSSQLTVTTVSPVANTDLTQGDDITVAQGASVNVSAPAANAGAISVSALGGTVDIEGALSGGTDAAHTAGSFSVVAGAFGGAGSFDRINSTLDIGGFTGSRGFELATGNILVDQTVQAHVVHIAADTGSLEVAGTIDASGATPGTIALSADGNLTLDGTAVLDAHATSVAQDSYGKDIDAENRAHVSLSTVAGTLTLDQGATINELYSTNDLSKVDSAQGVVVLNAPRNGGNDANFAATGSVTIQGAASVALVAWAAYAPGDADGTIVQDNGGSTPVSAAGVVGMNQIDAASQAYMAGALASPGAGLKSVAAALSANGALASLLQPGVEIDSAAATGGNLTISGDLNFSTFRYGPNANPATGAGTPGVVLFRAANNLTVNGSVTDGFLPPPDSLPGNTLSADTAGWVYRSGTADPTNSDILLPSSAFATAMPNSKHPMSTSEFELDVGTGFSTQRPISLNYAITIAQANVRSNVVIPFAAILGKASAPIPAGGWVATAPILASDGSVLFAKGTLIPGGTVLAVGDVIQPGTVLPVQVTVFNNTVVPQGTQLDIFASAVVTLSAPTAILPEDAFIPANTRAVFQGVFANGVAAHLFEIDLRATDAQGVQGYLYPLASMLPNGSQSWSLNFVAGGNLASANSLAVLPKTVLSAGGEIPASDTDNGAPGSILLDDQHYATSNIGTDAIAAFSVIRTGTGDLNLVAGGNFDQSSLYGIYTAGSQTSADSVGTNTDGFNAGRYAYGTDGGILPENFSNFPAQDIITLNNIIATTYQAYYPAGGGDVLVAAQGNVTGDVLGTGFGSSVNSTSGPPSDSVGDWLWRQGSTQLGQPTAWWINFGTFVEPLDATENDTGNPPQLVGFQGIGALGGGNVTVIAGGDAGQMTDRESRDSFGVPRGEGLVVAVGSTGRLALGSATPTITGGGNITIDIAGALNPIDANAYALNSAGNGDVTDLRGNISITAGSIGRIAPTFSVGVPDLNLATPVNDPRPSDPFSQNNGLPEGGIIVVPGDGDVSIATRGDLVLAGAGDPGREPEQNLTAVNTSAFGSLNNFGGFTGFTLWQAGTTISLFSAGGSVTPTTVSQDYVPGGVAITNDLPTDYRSIYPPSLLVTAATGDIIYGKVGDEAFSTTSADSTDFSLETAPAPNGQVAFLAGGSIFANGYAIDISGADAARVSSPSDPAFTSDATNVGLSVTNIRTGGGTNQNADALFAFEADTPTTDLHADDPQPALFYAAGGDIVNFQTGETLTFSPTANEPVTTWYIAAKPVWIEASGDIVSSGVRPSIDPGSNVQENQAQDGALAVPVTTSGNLFLNTGPESISVVSAGRDILSGFFYVGGPGLLEVDAGRNLYQAAASTGGTQTLDFGTIRSLGALISGAPVSLTSGASIAALAGMGTGADDTGFANLYFNAANQANLALPITDPANKGKVQQVYATQLLAWLQTNQAYTGDQAGALAYFLALPPVRQDVFVREIFFEDILASGRQYNDPTSRFYHDYARGRLAIDTLFPSAPGTEITPGVPSGYSGAITMYSGTIDTRDTSVPAPITDASGNPVVFDGGIATLFGGNVQVLDPGGQVELGIPGGPAPGNASGIITYGTGDIDIYALGNVLLGKSRIFTTAGGNIEIWSSEGDINAGIGAKTTVAYNPPVLSYDDTGGITDTPTVPTNGAGIATLAPLPSIPAGDIDLIAPLGTIDAGEAGIRVSGNLNLAAARLANTANIAVGGKTSGTASVTVASLGAVEAAGAAAGAAASAAQSTGTRNTNQGADTAAVLDVDVVSIGGTYEEDQRKKKRPAS